MPIACFLAATVFSLFFTAMLLPLLKRTKIGQNILSYVSEHTQKQGTPTMGGIAFLLAASLASALLIGFSRELIATLSIGLGFALVGFCDDFLKEKHAKNLGFTAWQKLLFQVVVGIFACCYLYFYQTPMLNLPFVNSSVFLGGWVFPLGILVFLSTTNAVNLCDGLDGLAAKSCTVFFACFGGILWLQDQTMLSLVCFCLAGGLTGFLPFNVHPAKLFMGDCGSLGLGGFAAAIALFSGNALYLLLLAVVFVVTVLSVVIQVIYYKKTGKRWLLMAPLHHHFQRKGYSEEFISFAYALVTGLVGCLLLLSVR